MHTFTLAKIAEILISPGRGILAMDESPSTCNRRFVDAGIPSTPEMRRKYRELLVTTPGLGEWISGAILSDETIRQTTRDGIPFSRVLEQAGIIPGIKVDRGTVDLAGHPNESATEGLDGLRERFEEYARFGVRFSKWRAILRIDDGTPSRGALEANAHALARFAAISQEAGILPIVEPEVLSEGVHTLERCAEVTEEVWRILFDELRIQRVVLEGLLLKANMIRPGDQSSRNASIGAVAEATVKSLARCVPPALPGIAFLSGGQEPALASAHLNAMNRRFANRMPWRLTFSYARALQSPVLAQWRGRDEEMMAAQKLLLHRARCNGAASAGNYDDSWESSQVLSVESAASLDGKTCH